MRTYLSLNINISTSSALHNNERTVFSESKVEFGWAGLPVVVLVSPKK